MIEPMGEIVVQLLEVAVQKNLEPVDLRLPELPNALLTAGLELGNVLGELLDHRQVLGRGCRPREVTRPPLARNRRSSRYQCARLALQQPGQLAPIASRFVVDLHPLRTAFNRDISLCLPVSIAGAHRGILALLRRPLLVMRTLGFFQPSRPDEEPDRDPAQQ
jgi:hypothetical protein